MKIAVLGCGPAGLLAAYAAERRGAQVEIVSDGEPSPISGAQWLQSPIPDLADEYSPRYISYVKLGSEDGYAQKAYGEPKAEISWSNFAEGEYPAWSLRTAYEQLWDWYGDQIHKHHIKPDDLSNFCEQADLVFCSIRADGLCQDEGHKFHGQPIAVTDEKQIDADEVIIYNGRGRDSWYRASKLFGQATTEYALHEAGESGDVPKVPLYSGVKPTWTDCNCHARLTNLIRIGRFGRWQRGVLTDQTYWQVWERVA